MEVDVALADRRLRCENPEMRWLALAALLVASRAGADTGPETAPETVDEHLARVRELYDKGDFAHARDELLAAYKLDARPELLFALGQVELNLGHFQKAIDYYEQFLATSPAADQAALAEQAIGAARARLAEKPPVVAPPPPPPHREWDVADSGIAAFGATALLAGAGLFVYSHQLAIDRSGTLSAYNHRLSRAALIQWTGVGCAAAGALAVAGAVLRWRLHLVDTEVQPVVAPRTAGLAWVRQW
jgi:tetratricopeptide (TPR) repeat protein